MNKQLRKLLIDNGIQLGTKGTEIIEKWLARPRYIATYQGVTLAWNSKKRTHLDLRGKNKRVATFRSRKKAWDAIDQTVEETLVPEDDIGSYGVEMIEE